MSAKIYPFNTPVSHHPLSPRQDFLIWTDTDNLNGVHMARMDTKEKVRGIIHPNVGVARDLITFDPRNQPAISSELPPVYDRL